MEPEILELYIAGRSILRLIEETTNIVGKEMHFTPKQREHKQAIEQYIAYITKLKAAP